MKNYIADIIGDNVLYVMQANYSDEQTIIAHIIDGAVIEERKYSISSIMELAIRVVKYCLEADDLGINGIRCRISSIFVDTSGLGMAVYDTLKEIQTKGIEDIKPEVFAKINILSTVRKRGIEVKGMANQELGWK